MRTIITVTESASLPGSFTVMSSARKDRRGNVYPATVRGGGPSAAAAKALEYAIDCGGGYAIVAPKKVMDCIPEDMRGRL